MEERKIETTPAELMKILGGALLEASQDEELEIVKHNLTLITLIGLKAVRHLTGVWPIDPDALDAYETDPEDLEQYLQDEERLREKMIGEMS